MCRKRCVLAVFNVFDSAYPVTIPRTWNITPYEKDRRPYMIGLPVFHGV